MTAAGDVIVPLAGRFNACAASVKCRGSMTSEPLDLALSVANSRRAWLGAREVMFDDWESYEIEATMESRSATGSSGSGIVPVFVVERVRVRVGGGISRPQAFHATA